MTKTRAISVKFASRIKPYCIFLLIPIILFLGKDLRAGAVYGLNLSIRTIIPTLLPFFVLSDLIGHEIVFSRNSLLGKIFTKTFGVSSVGVSAVLTGMLCGFPLGVKSASDLFVRGEIDKDELNLLSVISNNPSMAFVISGVGYAIYGDVILGVIIYFSIIISSFIVGTLFRLKNKEINKSHEIIGQKFDFVSSVNKAGLSCITVTSYIIFFSAFIFLFKSICNKQIVTLIFASFMEISTACSLIKETSFLSPPLRLSLTAFSLGFSGFSVHMQALSHLPKGSVDLGGYIFKKILIGLLSFLISFAIFNII